MYINECVYVKLFNNNNKFFIKLNLTIILQLLGYTFFDKY